MILLVIYRYFLNVRVRAFLVYNIVNIIPYVLVLLELIKTVL